MGRYHHNGRRGIRHIDSRERINRWSARFDKGIFIKGDKMAATKTMYICNNCGEATNKWFGRCPNCGEWNTLTEEVAVQRVSSKGKSASSSLQSAETTRLDSVTTDDEARFSTGIPELDRVLGGGIVKGSAVLIGGEPGAGKSTLLLQVCGNIGEDVLYFSGEESIRQIKLRANRLGIAGENIEIANETDIESIINTILQRKPSLVVIDSIQTMSYSAISSSPGSVTQVRECASMLLRVAKSQGIAIFMVGHVNKDGAIAGPKVMEHIVDAVLYFEGDKYLSYRILRGAKNRFGSTNELGMFEMGEKGLSGIANPSEALLDGRGHGISGSCVTCIVEGTRPILSEIQSLVAKTGFGTPRRTTAGFDFNRANLLIAVLEKRAGYYLSNLDVYINVVGGLQFDEPAADLAVASSIVSSLLDRPIPEDSFTFGEIGLGGEIRAVQNAQSRLYEASNLGFTRCLMPKSNAQKIDNAYGIDIIPVSNVSDIKKLFKDESMR